MNALRGAVILLAQLVLTPLAMTGMFLAMPFGGNTVYGIARLWCISMVRLAALLGLRHTIVHDAAGADRAPAVVLCKHSSAWETFFLVSHFPRMVPVAKRELAWVPFFGWGLALTRPILINRSQRREARAQLHEQGADRVRDGLWIMIFPEGTRIPAGYRGRYAAGGAGLAIATGTPVIAVAHDAGHFWRKSFFDKRAGTIQVSISDRLHARPGETAIDLTRRAEAWIEGQIERYGHPPARLTAAAEAALAADASRPAEPAAATDAPGQR